MSDTSEILQRDQEGRCIVCGKKSRDRRRGLCIADYNRFRNALAQVPPDQRGRFEKLLIEQGKLLPSRQGKRLDDENAYEIELRKFLAQLHRETSDQRSDEDAEALADQLISDAEEIQGETSNQKPKKPAKSRKSG